MRAYGSCNPGGPAHAYGIPVPTLVRPTGRNVLADVEVARTPQWRIPVTEPARKGTWAPVKVVRRARRRAEIAFKGQATANEAVRLYVEDKLTIPQIAERLRISRRTIRHHLLAQGVTLRDDRKGHTGGQNARVNDPAFVAQAVKAYEGGLSVQAVAYAIGTGPRQVRAALTLAGIPVAPQRSRLAGINGATRLADRLRAHETVAAVLALHKPVQRWLPYPDAEWSYATEQEAREWDDDTKPTPFTVCNECGRIEMGRDDYDAPDYEAALWPCRTAKACGITHRESAT